MGPLARGRVRGKRDPNEPKQIGAQLPRVYRDISRCLAQGGWNAELTSYEYIAHGTDPHCRSLTF